jgi:hypothetical protein
MSRARSTSTVIVVALLLTAAWWFLLVEPWRGPVVLPLWDNHGIDAADLPALPLVALAVGIAMRRRRTS